jgi:hypothetical protein
MSSGSWDPADGFDAITGPPTSPDLRTISSAGRASSNSNARTNVNNKALILQDIYENRQLGRDINNGGSSRTQQH